MCNDLFWWATADCEPITPANVELLEQAWAALKGLDQDYYVGDLFAAMSRQMRPQQPCYERMNEHVKVLFDACGPVRDRKDEG